MAHPETVTAGTLRTIKPLSPPKASTITAKEGRMVEENRLDRIKKGTEFVVLRDGRSVDLPKHTMVDVVSQHGYVLSYYAEKKGRLTGPAVFRMRTVAPSDVPSRWSAFCRALRGLGILWLWAAGMALMLAVGLANLDHEMGPVLLLVPGLFFCLAVVVVCVGVRIYGNRGRLQDTFTVHPLPPRKEDASVPAPASLPSLSKDANLAS